MHAHPTFSLGGKEARAIQLMHAFGDAAEHSILIGNPKQHSARDSIDPALKVGFPTSAPRLRGLPGLGRLSQLARYMRRFDLVLTYNCGAFDAVMAKRLFGGAPLVHHEDGFNADEAVTLKARRNALRRLGLPAAFRVVVPSRQLEALAGSAWRQPPERIAHIANGVAAGASRGHGPPLAIPGLVRRPGELIVATVAGLRPVKNLPRLVRAFAGAGAVNARLVLFGEGPERGHILEEARRMGVAERVHLAGFVDRPARYLGGCDIFALSSDSEQQPIALLEAMGAGLPVVATAVGDIDQMVAELNRPMIVPAADEAAFGTALARLIAQPTLRDALGRANRAKVAADHDEPTMIAAYARLYGAAIGRPGALLS